jgi:oligoribonuclease
MERIFWIDLEMTGLDVEKEVVIEAAAIVTDVALGELDTYETVVRQPQGYLDAMDAWNTEHHGASGLTARVPAGREPSLVEDDLIALVAKHFTAPAVIAGNSIAQDRLFINRGFPRFAGTLHYRMLDVTAWKVMMEARFGIRFEKKKAHRALDDIRESLDEMRFYLRHVSPTPLS